ncbi:MAG: hypothetical protein E6K81_10200, partial [Candidatus Eisenbacteria bacterium]
MEAVRAPSRRGRLRAPAGRRRVARLLRPRRGQRERRRRQALRARLGRRRHPAAARPSPRRLDAHRHRRECAGLGDGRGAGVPQARVPRRRGPRPRGVRQRRRGPLPGRRRLLLRRAGVRGHGALQSVREPPGPRGVERRRGRRRRRRWRRLRARAQDRRGAHRRRRPRGAHLHAGAGGLRPPSHARGRGGGRGAPHGERAGQHHHGPRPVHAHRPAAGARRDRRAAGARGGHGPRPRRPAGRGRGDGEPRPGGLESARAPLHALDPAARRGAATLARSGSLIVRARADDARGNRITAEATVWVYDARVVDYAYRYSTLEAFTDRDRYQPGDTARILVNTDVRGARVLVSVEGRDLYQARVVPLTGNTGLVQVPLRPAYAPNVFVALHVRKGPDVQTRVLEIPVKAERHDLAITLAPDRERYRPGEAANVTIRTRDGRGAPVAAEVSLGVVDEAIYSLRADATPDPHDVFYGRRPNGVTTAVSFPVHYYGGASKGGREEPRRDFRDVAHWAPSVATDSTGQARVTFKWPDNLTTWRLTSRGATDAALVGRAVTKTLVSKDIVARLALPRQFVAGDAADLVSIVTNRTPGPLTGVREGLEASGLARLTGTASRTSDLPAAGESRGGWPVAIARDLPADADSARARFVFRARSKADADALELTAPVRAKAVALRPHGAGVLTEPRAAVTVALPGDLIRAGSTLALDLSPSPAAMCLGAVDWLYGSPYACTEQTVNAMLPACALLAAARQADVVVPGWSDPAARLAPHLDHLAALQHADGGWGWWQSGESDPYLTALAIDALAAATRLGLANAAADQALGRVPGHLMLMLGATRSRDGEAYVLAHVAPLLALEHGDERFPGLKDRLGELATSVYTARAELGDAALALAVTGEVALGRLDEAKALWARLETRARKDGAGLSWPSGDEEGWFGEAHENTGYALQAMLALDAHDPRAADVVRWLAARRRGAYWRCTRSTGPVAIALARYLEGHAAEMKPEMRLRVEWNGVVALERALTPADVFGGAALRVAIPGARLKPGPNTLTLTRDGTGTLYWAWEAKAMVPSPGPPSGAEKRL